MSEESQVGEEQTPDEKTVLRDRLKNMGVKVSPNASVERLREQLQTALNGDQKDDEAPKPAGSKKAQIRRRMQREKKALVRVRITCLNPHKKELYGELFTVANQYLGNVTRFVPFGEQTDDGWHIEKVIYDKMKNRKFLQKKVRKNKQTKELEIIQKWVPEFAIEELEPLTKSELKDLANQQAAAGSVDSGTVAA